MTPQAEKLWIDFYHQWKKERRGYPLKQAKLTARTFEHVLKIAVVYSVLAEEREIGSDHMEIAITIGKWLQSNTLQMFTDIGLDHVGKCERAIVDRLKRATNDRMWRRDLQREMSNRNFNGEIFNRAIKTLEINDHISCQTVIAGSGRARPMVSYIARHKTDKSAKD
jgi:hypothetical protein